VVLSPGDEEERFQSQREQAKQLYKNLKDNGDMVWITSTRIHSSQDMLNEKTSPVIHQQAVHLQLQQTTQASNTSLFSLI
jgi:hypothetical protein